MADDMQERTNTTMDSSDQTSITIYHHGKPHILALPSDSSISDLSDEIAARFSIPASNQKLLIAKLGLQKPPFKDPSIPIATLLQHKITLIGSTATEANAIAEASAQAARIATRRKDGQIQKVKAYKSHDWKKEQEESQYTFTTLRPLPYLPNPEKSLRFLQRLKDDAGIKASMRKHKFTVPLLTEMNPVEHTQSNHEGTSRTLGLNRNQGEVIELRLRTDAYDGYRDYKTIRKTLCHELAHNVHGPHDRNFWDLCKEIEKEVEKADWRSGGHSIGGGQEFYSGGGEEEEHYDECGWTGGEFVLGADSTGGAESTGTGGSTSGNTQGMSRREILAKAAEERLKRASGSQSHGPGSSTGA